MFSQNLTTLSEEEFRTIRYQDGYLDRIRSEHFFITSQPQIGSFEHFLKQENKRKNRYPDIACWDDSRVKITSSDWDTDYIHANYMNLYETPRQLIATQGPLEETIGQFWQMIWEQNSCIIVMLTKFQDAGEEKCAKYWNTRNKQKDFQTGSLSIKIEDEQQNSGYIKIIFEVTNKITKESRRIIHYQYLEWPDHSVPSNGQTLTALIMDMTDEHQEPSRKATNGPTEPIVVHCNSGTGRTGAFCAIISCLTQLAKTQEVSVPKIVMKLREQRRSSVIILRQYQFIYTVLYEFLRLFDAYPQVRRKFVM